MDGETLVATYPSLFTPEDMPIPWTESPFFAQMLERSGLDASDRDLVQGFSRDGFVVIDPQLPPDLLDRANRDLEGRHPIGPGGQPQRIQDAWRYSDAVKEIAASPMILELLRTLYRREPIPFQTLNFAVGTEQRTHSDTIHFQTYPPNWMCGVWVALEDVDDGNGPLHYYAGSHRGRLYDMADLNLQSDYGAYPSYEDFVEALADVHGWQRRTLSIPRGSALVWAANLLHGGEPIAEAGRTRRTQVTHYYFDNCTYYTPMSSDVFLGRIAFRTDLVDLRTGDAVEHSYKGHRFKPRRSDFPALLPARVVGSRESVATAPTSGSWQRWLPPALVPRAKRMIARLRMLRP